MSGRLFDQRTDKLGRVSTRLVKPVAVNPTAPLPVPAKALSGLDDVKAAVVQVQTMVRVARQIDGLLRTFSRG